MKGINVSIKRLSEIMLELQEKGEYTGIREFRKHLAFYSKGLSKASEFRNKINILNSKDEVLLCIEKYFN